MRLSYWIKQEKGGSDYDSTVCIFDYIHSDNANYIQKISKAVRQTDMPYVPELLILQCLVWPLYLYRAYISVKKKRDEREKSNEHKN